MDEAKLQFSSEWDRHLFELQLRVAQRADELSRLLGNRPGHSFELWRQAESETWSQLSSDESALKKFVAMSALLG